MRIQKRRQTLNARPWPRQYAVENHTPMITISAGRNAKQRTVMYRRVLDDVTKQILCSIESVTTSVVLFCCI